MPVATTPAAMTPAAVAMAVMMLPTMSAMMAATSGGFGGNKECRAEASVSLGTLQF